MAPVFVVGVDLSGPANVAPDCRGLAGAGGRWPSLRGPPGGSGRRLPPLPGLGLAGVAPTVVGLHARLSYNPGGGDRPADKALRKQIQAVGVRSGSIMTLKAARMAYLTLRGIGIARHVASLDGEHAVRVVEVHPRTAFGLGGAPLEAVMSLPE